MVWISFFLPLLKEDSQFINLHYKTKLLRLSHKKKKKSIFDNSIQLLPKRILTNLTIMSDDEDIAALVVDNGSGMCKGKTHIVFVLCL
jgi:hypothetical protein